MKTMNFITNEEFNTLSPSELNELRFERLVNNKEQLKTSDLGKVALGEVFYTVPCFDGLKEKPEPELCVTCGFSAETNFYFNEDGSLSLLWDDIAMNKEGKTFKLQEVPYFDTKEEAQDYIDDAWEEWHDEFSMTE